MTLICIRRNGSGIAALAHDRRAETGVRDLLHHF